MNIFKNIDVNFKYEDYYIQIWEINDVYQIMIYIYSEDNMYQLYAQNKLPSFDKLTEAFNFLQHYSFDDCLFESNYYLVTEEFNINGHSLKEGDLLLVPTYEKVNTQFFGNTECMYTKYKEKSKVYSLDGILYDINKVVSYI